MSFSHNSIFLYAGRDLVMLTVHASKFFIVDTITHWTLDFDLRSWFQQLARMLKLCTRLVLTFSWPFCKVTKYYSSSILYHWHHNSSNCLILTFDHSFNSYQWWCSYTQNLLLWPWSFFDTLKGRKQLRLFPLFTMDAWLNAGDLTSLELPCIQYM